MGPRLIEVRNAWGLVKFCFTVLLSHRTGIAAGSTVPIDLMKQLIGKLNLHELTIAYGMSECFLVSSVLRCPADQGIVN